MIKYGQFVKFTCDMEVSVSKNWTRIAENFHTVYKEINAGERWNIQFLVPQGTVGLLKYLLVNERHNKASIALPDPTTKRITNVTVWLYTKDFTFDVSEEEKKPYLMTHRKFVAQKINDGFKAIDLIEHAKNYTE